MSRGDIASLLVCISDLFQFFLYIFKDNLNIFVSFEVFLDIGVALLEFEVFF